MLVASSNTAGGVTAVAVGGTRQRTRWITTRQCVSARAGRAVAVEASGRGTYFGATHAWHARIGGDAVGEGAGFSNPADTVSRVECVTRGVT